MTAEAGWDDELGGELRGILPSLGDATPRDAGAAIADERFRAHRAVRRLLELLAGEQPVVLVLDDLHWADDASVELLTSLVRRPPRGAVLIACAFRPGQASERLAAVAAADGGDRVLLGPLSEAEAREKLGGIPAAAAAAIYRHGGGNSFYLEQLARGGDLEELPAARHAGAGRACLRAERRLGLDRGRARGHAPEALARPPGAAGRRPVRARPRGRARRDGARRGADRARRPPRARPRPRDHRAAALPLPAPVAAPRRVRIGARGWRGSACTPAPRRSSRRAGPRG